MKRLLCVAVALGSLIVAPPSARAQEAPWPNRPVTFMSGFPNGAGTDIYLRRFSEPLQRALGQPIVVDNRSGAGGNIGSDLVAKARPDGYLFLIGTAGTHAINATLYRSLPFNVERDFTPVILLGDVPNVLLVNPERRPNLNSCQAVLAAARARPQALTFGSTGNGASTHLAGVIFSMAAGIDLLHVPYRGQPGAMQALLAGDTDLFFNQSGPSIGPVRQGQLRALFTLTRERLPALPDVPTVAEACGLPPMDTSTWYGIFAPPGLPDPILRRMNAELARIIAEPDFQRWLTDSQGITPPPPPAQNTPENFARVLRADVARWGDVVRRSGATVD